VKITDFGTIMDKTITATQARRKFLHMLEDVRAGDTYTVTYRGKVVALVEPVAKEQKREHEVAGPGL